MPEPYWPKHKHSYTLGDAMKNALYARIWCGYCKRSRYFLLEDLKRLFGNIECDHVVYKHPWHCTGCQGAGVLHMRLEDPPAAGGAIVRRLDSIRYTRRIYWRDEHR